MEERASSPFEWDTNEEFGVTEDLVSPPEHKVADITPVYFGGLLTRPLQLREDLKEGCGGQLWPAGMVLAKYLLRQSPEMFKNRDILELGAGGGLVGLALALKAQRETSKFEHPHIHITDQLPMYRLMEDNIALNSFPTCLVRASILDWGTPIAALNINQPDILLAADCVYFEPAFPLLLQTMGELIGPETVCYFCFKKRRKADLRFIRDAKKMFDIKDIEDDPDRSVWSREGLFLYRITKKIRSS